MISHGSSEKRLWWRPSQRPSSRRMQGQNLAHKSLPWGRRFFSLMDTSVKVKFWPIRSDDGPNLLVTIQSIECIGICMDLLCEGCLPSSWDGFFLACCQAAPEWDQGWTWVSTWKSSRIRRHWSFKASWQIWFAEIKERFEIFDVSHFLQVCLDIRGPKNMHKPHWFHLQMLTLSSQKHVTKPPAACPLTAKKTATLQVLPKRLKKGWGGLGGFTSAVSVRQPIRPF